MTGYFLGHWPEVHCLVDKDFEAEDLDELHEALYEGIENDEFCAEDEIPNNFDPGQISSIECTIIQDLEGKEVFRDSDFKTSLCLQTRDFDH